MQRGFFGMNALDHGVLGLDSKIKEDTDGINRYFEIREQLLYSLNEGYVRIGVTIHPTQQGGRIVIEVEDSGEGFDHQTLHADVGEAAALLEKVRAFATQVAGIQDPPASAGGDIATARNEP